jgi:hypothetical protein
VTSGEFLAAKKEKKKQKQEKKQQQQKTDSGSELVNIFYAC